MLKSTFALALSAGFACTCLADELHVPSQYPTIQAAIDAAVNGDEIVIATGTYRELLDMLGKQITLRSTDSNDPGTVDATILSGDTDNDGSPDGTVITCNSGETESTRIEGLTIRDGSAPAGGGVLLDGTSITIDRCHFTANSNTDSFQGGGAIAVLGGSLTLTGCAFDGNTSSRRGIDIYSIDADIDLVGCTFDADTPDIGEFAIYHLNSGSLNFTDSHFRDRTGNVLISNSLAAVTISGCSFERSTGGSVHMVVDTALVQDSAFRDNKLNNTSSAILNAALGFRGNNLTIEDCEFVSNYVPEDLQQEGSAVFADGGEAMIRGCDFIGNTAPEGFGTAMLAGCQSTTIEDCHFGHNLSSHGAIDFVNYGTNVHIKACTFIGNIGRDAGAIFLHRPIGVIEACHFERNQAIGHDSLPNRNGYGGAVYVDSVRTEPFRFRDCTFVANSAATDGGAIYATESRGAGNVSLDRCSFYGNLAQGLGGGALLSNSSMRMVSHCVFVDNQAGAGGALFQWNTDVIQSVFVNNMATSGMSMRVGDFSDSTQTSNCIYIGDGSTPHLDDSTDPDEELVVDHCIVTGGYKGPGAGSHIYDVEPMFVRMPSDGGDGWGDDPATIGIDEGLNDDFGDLRLSANSWGIDAGDDSSVPADIFDLDNDGDTTEPVPFDAGGNPRFADDPAIPGSSVDIGAYEFQGTSCLADVNRDGMLSPTDFSAWVGAFNTNAPECDQNGDGMCTPTDFSAWVGNFNAGC